MCIRKYNFGLHYLSQFRLLQLNFFLNKRGQIYVYYYKSIILFIVNAVFFHGKYSGGQHFKANKSIMDDSACESDKPKYKPLTMDDMPVPCGSWIKHHNKVNSRYNIILVFGFVSLIGSLFIVSQTNVFYNFIIIYGCNLFMMSIF